MADLENSTLTVPECIERYRAARSEYERLQAAFDALEAEAEGHYPERPAIITTQKGRGLSRAELLDFLEAKRHLFGPKTIHLWQAEREARFAALDDFEEAYDAVRLRFGLPQAHQAADDAFNAMLHRYDELLAAAPRSLDDALAKAILIQDDLRDPEPDEESREFEALRAIVRDLQQLAA